MKANQELFDGCGDTQSRRLWNQTISRLNENVAKNLELVSEISMVECKAQNATLRAEHEISLSDIDRCRGQAGAFNKQAEELRSEIKALERSNKDIQRQRDQIEQRMRDW